MALNSRGSQFFYDAGDTAGLSAVEECRNISGPDGSAATIDTTHLTSTGKEFLADFPDFGDVTLTCNYTGGTVQQNLFDAFQASADPAPCQIKVPQAVGSTDYHAFNFNAIVTKWSIAEAVGSQVTLTVTLHVTGAVTYNAT